MTPVRGPSQRSARAILAALALALTVPATAMGSDGWTPPPTPFVTTTPGNPLGITFVPLVNSGDVAFGDTFAGLPDGIGVVPRKKHFPDWLPYLGRSADYVDLYVNHEESHVPFGTVATNVFADTQDSSVTRVRISTKPPYNVIDMEVVLPGTAGFIRFCSSTMAGPREGFPFYTLLLNEESNDLLPVPAGAVYGADPSTTPNRQAGYTVWLNTVTKKYDVIANAGRHNHENTVVIPGGWRHKIVGLSGDDTFTSTSSPTHPNLSQLYMFAGRNWLDYTRDTGTLYAFRVTGTQAGPLADPASATNGANDFFEIAAGLAPWTGEFIPVPANVAQGYDPAYPTKAPQDVLEDWSNDNNVFQFIRVEDIDYDPDNPRVVYFADTGNTRLLETPVGGPVGVPGEGRLYRAASGTAGTSSSVGRIFKMVLNAQNPLIVDQFSVVVEASSLNDGTGRTMISPDNVDAGSNSLMVQEDTTNAHIWRWDYGSTWTHIATVDSVPTSPNTDPGESTGIMDMSPWLGAGWWALNVQAHQDPDQLALGAVHTDQYLDPNFQVWSGGPIPPGGANYRLHREKGQLLLMHVPGS